MTTRTIGEMRLLGKVAFTIITDGEEVVYTLRPPTSDEEDIELYHNTIFNRSESFNYVSAVITCHTKTRLLNGRIFFTSASNAIRIFLGLRDGHYQWEDMDGQRIHNQGDTEVGSSS